MLPFCYATYLSDVLRAHNQCINATYIYFHFERRLPCSAGFRFESNPTTTVKHVACTLKYFFFKYLYLSKCVDGHIIFILYAANKHFTLLRIIHDMALPLRMLKSSLRCWTDDAGHAKTRRRNIENDTKQPTIIRQSYLLLPLAPTTLQFL